MKRRFLATLAAVALLASPAAMATANDDPGATPTPVVTETATETVAEAPASETPETAATENTEEATPEAVTDEQPAQTDEVASEAAERSAPEAEPAICDPTVAVSQTSANPSSLRSWDKVELSFTGCSQVAGDIVTVSLPSIDIIRLNVGEYPIYNDGVQIGTLSSDGQTATFSFTADVDGWNASLWASITQSEVGEISPTITVGGKAYTVSVGTRVPDYSGTSLNPYKQGTAAKWSSYNNDSGFITSGVTFVPYDNGDDERGAPAGSITIVDTIDDGNSQFICNTARGMAAPNTGMTDDGKWKDPYTTDSTATVECTATQVTVRWSETKEGYRYFLSVQAKPLTQGNFDPDEKLNYYSDVATFSGIDVTRPAQAFVYGGGGNAWKQLPPPSTPVTPVSPTITAGTCQVGSLIPTEPTVTVPETEGLTYSEPEVKVDGQDVAVTVTATPAEGDAIDSSALPEGWAMNDDGTATYTGSTTQPVCEPTAVEVTSPEVEAGVCIPGSTTPTEPTVTVPADTDLVDYSEPVVETKDSVVTVTVHVGLVDDAYVLSDDLPEGWLKTSGQSATFTATVTQPTCTVPTTPPATTDPPANTPAPPAAAAPAARPPSLLARTGPVTAPMVAAAVALIALGWATTRIRRSRES